MTILLSGHFHFSSFIQCPDEIWHNSAHSLQRAASRLFPEHTTVIGQYYFWFECNNAMNAMETIDGEPCICID
jgi:hypothetical protein